MSDKIDLRVDWCSHAAAKYAVEHWHYSHTMPKSKLAKLGAWENSDFIGTVIFGVGATSGLVRSYGLKPTEGCELVRVALNAHFSSVSQIVAACIKKLKLEMPGLRLIVSFADPERNHAGIIYQAGNWVYTGMSIPSPEYIVNGKRWHGRAFRASKPAHLTTKEAAALMDENFEIVQGSSKYRYLYPLDRAMRKQIAPLAQPYPKRDPCGQSVEGDTSNDQLEGAGSIPAARSIHADATGREPVRVE